MDAPTLNQLYGFKDLALVPPGHFSPVGMSRDGSVYGTFVPAHTGEAVATRVITGGEFCPLADSLSLIEAVGGDGMVVGSFGYGERGFSYRDESGIHRLDSTFEFSSASCIGPDGLVGGSITVDGIEHAAVFQDGKAIRLPGLAQSVVAISSNGVVAGKTQSKDIFLWKVHDQDLHLVPFEGQAAWVAGFMGQDDLVMTIQRDFVTSHAVVYANGDIEFLPGLGGATCRVVAVGASGIVVMSGTNEDGRLTYGVYERGKGVTVMDPHAVPGMTLESLNGVGPNGEIIGLANSKDGMHLVMGSPVAQNRTHAVVEV